MINLFKMRKLVLFMHTTLDGFVGGPHGELDWVLTDDEIFDFAKKLTDQSDTALYGRVTYQLMESYWPTAGEKPDATKQDKHHSAWYNKVEKIVVSRTLNHADLINASVINDHLIEEVNQLKQKAGKNIVIFGSPGIAKELINKNIIDDYWLFLNPVLLGHGILLFNGYQKIINLHLLSTHTFANGVVCLHYNKIIDPSTNMNYE